jgi:hypothetical protein
MRRAARVDANHKQIVDWFRQCRFQVLDLSRVGQGCPDLLISMSGHTALVEIKDGNKPPSGRKLTPDEQKFHRTWKGLTFIVESIDDAQHIIEHWPQ